MRMRHIDFGRAQRGWTCELTFTFESFRQFTDEEHTVIGSARWSRFGLLGMVSAFLEARQNALVLIQDIRAIGGPHNRQVAI